jgi:hypothetical protein
MAIKDRILLGLFIFLLLWFFVVALLDRKEEKKFPRKRSPRVVVSQPRQDGCGPGRTLHDPAVGLVGRF